MASAAHTQSHARFADDTVLVMEIEKDSVVPIAEPTTLPRPADLARVGTFLDDSQPSTSATTPNALNDDPEKALQTKPVDKATTQDIYDKYTNGKKNRITAIVSFAALLAPFASSSFLPSIPQLARDLHTTASIIDYTVCIYLVCLGIAPLAWAPYATLYGRRPIYLVSLPIFIAGSIGVAVSHSLGALIATRIIQAVGSSSVLSVGAGTIGDIYRPTERGRAMGVFYAGALIGPALAPVVAGVLTEYAHGPAGGWRSMQWLLAAMGVLSLALTAVALPETIHVKGIERVIEERRKKKGLKEGEGKKEKWVWVWLDPLRPVRLLKYPNVLAISFNSSLVLMTTYCLLVPLTYTLGPRFGISNAAILGTLYLATGFGNLIGSRIAGHFSDRAVRIWIGKRGGERIPEDRLRASLIAGGIVVPLSLLGTGFTMQYWTSAGGLALSLIFLVISGIGLMGALSINNTYLVDVMQKRSVEAIAVNNCMRYAFAAGASAGVLPLIETIGVGPTNAIAAGVSWLGFVFVLATIKWGVSWRTAVDERAERKAEEKARVKEQEQASRDHGEKMVEASRRTSMTLRET